MTPERFRIVVAMARARRASASLCSALGVSRMTVSRWARSSPRPSAWAGAGSWLAREFGLTRAVAGAWLEGRKEAALDEAAARACGELRLLRDLLGETVEESAASAGVSRVTWMRWERLAWEAPASAVRAADALRKRFLLTS